MSFLKRLALIRQINNGKSDEHIGNHPEGFSFIEESHGRSCVISEPALVRALLEHPNAHAYNHLKNILSDIEPERINYLQHFLEQSPEFLEGQHQRQRLKETKRIIKDFETACRLIKPTDLQDAIQQANEKEASLTTSLLSKVALSSLLNQALNHHQPHTNQKPFHPKLITIEGGFFSAAPRVNRLLAMNQSIRDQWGGPTRQEQDEEQYLLELIRIMGSFPTHAAITGSLNALRQLQIGSEMNDVVPDNFLTDDCFKRVMPTRYVTREVAESFELKGISFKKGDGLILFLADATQAKQCPLRNLQALPFGAGRHFCPGKNLAQTIHNTCLQAIVTSGTLNRAKPSQTIQAGLNAFVDYAQ